MSGIFWSPIDLGQQNFPLNLAGEKNPSMYLAVFFTVINLAGVALGNTVGGLMVQGVYTHLETLKFNLLGLTLNRYHYIFVTSSALRILAVIFVLPLVREAGSHATRPVVHEITQNSFTGVKRGLLRFQTYVRNKK
jgi:hypothetical protein